MAVTNQTLVDTSFKTIIKTVCDNAAITDGDNVKIVDASALSGADSNPRLSIAKIFYSIESASGGVELKWDATTNVQCTILTGNGSYGYMPGQPALTNNAGSGISGDVNVVNATGTFTLVTEFHKISGFTNTNEATNP